MTNVNHSVWLHFIVALSLVFGCVVLTPEPAMAATDNIDSEPNELQAKVEATAAAYDEAAKKAESLQTEIDKNEVRLADIQTQIPGQQEKSDNAMKTLYKFHQEGFSLVNMLINTENLDEFLTTIEYLNLIQTSNLNAMDRMQTLQNDLENTKQKLTTTKAGADAQKEEAEKALITAQEAREAAHQKALAEAAAQAAQVEAAMQAAKAAKAAEEAKNAPQTTPPTDVPSSSAPGPSDVNWASDKVTFVNEWTGRIDNYLAGSPLAGQGKTFAAAAWDYGVDPRWSPAISNTESSKGLYCFRSHNAWGWGQIDWGSWEEAINAHVRGLARGYGSTISYAAAQKYCPPNADHWYTSTLAQMEMI
ncbi:MAG: hypothetical protein RR862_01195 [Eggerthellaceae bacterium]